MTRRLAPAPVRRPRRAGRRGRRSGGRPHSPTPRRGASPRGGRPCRDHPRGRGRCRPRGGPGAGRRGGTSPGPVECRRRRRACSQAHHALARACRLRVTGRWAPARSKPKRRAVARTASAEARRPASSSSVIGTSTRSPTPPECTIAGTDRHTSLDARTSRRATTTPAGCGARHPSTASMIRVAAGPIA